MDDDFVAAHIVCTKQEKRLCLATAKKLINLANITRREGLLKLEAMATENTYQYPPIIRIGVELIVDGTDPKVVSHILENYLLTSGLSNQEFLDNIISYYAIQSIQLGYSLTLMKEIMCSFFGFDFREEFRAFLPKEQDFDEISKRLQLSAKSFESQKSGRTETRRLTQEEINTLLEE